MKETEGCGIWGQEEEPNICGRLENCGIDGTKEGPRVLGTETWGDPELWGSQGWAGGSEGTETWAPLAVICLSFPLRNPNLPPWTPTPS